MHAISAPSPFRRARSIWLPLAAIVATFVMPSALALTQPSDTAPAEPTVFVGADVARDGVAAGAAVLDTRDPVEFLAGHVPGAVQVRWSDFSSPDAAGPLHPDIATLEALVASVGVDDGLPVLIVGSWRDGWGEEGRLWWMLRYLGVTDVAILEGGWPAWRDAGLPIEPGPTEARRATFRARVDPSRAATVDDLALPGVLVIDARTPAEFAGATPYGSRRGGHIPGAVNLPWNGAFTPNGGLLPPESVRALVGAPVDRPIVVYCTGGVRSAFLAAVLASAGYTEVMNYAGSWWEYAATDLPVE